MKESAMNRYLAASPGMRITHYNCFQHNTCSRSKHSRLCKDQANIAIGFGDEVEEEEVIELFEDEVGTEAPVDMT